MRVLVDENAPVQVVPPLIAVLPAHDIVHVDDLRWKQKRDVNLLRDARQAGFDVLLTIDRRQLENPEEMAAIRKAKIHHVTFPQSKGLAGLARTIAGVIAQMPGVMGDLADADGQRLVRIGRLKAAKRYEIIDPSTSPYWRR